MCGCVGYHNPWGRHNPGSVPIVPGERFRGPLGVATAVVALGVAVACSCRLGIVYKCRAVVGSDSLVIEPLAGFSSLLLYVTLLLNFGCVD